MIMEYVDVQIVRKLPKIFQKNFDETLTHHKWDNLRFNQDKNVSGLKPIKFIKIHELIIRVSVDV